MPASRRQRATILAPRSWPSRPTLAISTRMGLSFMVLASSSWTPILDHRRGPRRPPPNLPQNRIAPALPALESRHSGRPLGAELAPEKRADRGVVKLGRDLRRQMPTAVEDDQLGSRDSLGQLVRIEARRHHVILRDDHERGRA